MVVQTRFSVLEPRNGSEQTLAEGEAILRRGKVLLEEEGKVTRSKDQHSYAYRLCTTIGTHQSMQCLRESEAPPRVKASTAG